MGIVKGLGHAHGQPLHIPRQGLAGHMVGHAVVGGAGHPGPYQHLLKGAHRALRLLAKGAVGQCIQQPQVV